VIIIYKVCKRGTLYTARQTGGGVRFVYSQHLSDWGGVLSCELAVSVAVCLQEMAVLSSATACAPITSHTTTPGSVPNIATCVIDQATVNTDRPAHKLAEKLHGLTEKLHSLGHHRSDSDTSTRTRTGTIGEADSRSARWKQSTPSHSISSLILSSHVCLSPYVPMRATCPHPILP